MIYRFIFFYFLHVEFPHRNVTNNVNYAYILCISNVLLYKNHFGSRWNDSALLQLNTTISYTAVHDIEHYIRTIWNRHYQGLRISLQLQRGARRKCTDIDLISWWYHTENLHENRQYSTPRLSLLPRSKATRLRSVHRVYSLNIIPPRSRRTLIIPFRELRVNSDPNWR